MTFEGLWIVQYAGMEGKDGGVVVLTKGQVLGGDSAFTYVGAYQESENGLTLQVLVQKFNPLMGNVLGIQGDFTLSLSLTTAGSGVLQGEGSTPAAAGFVLKVRLTQKAKLL